MAELTEAVAEVAESVAEEALNVASVSRSLSARDLGIGLTIGGSLSSLVTFLFVRRRFENKLNQLIESEVGEMREYYRTKLDELIGATRVATVDKPELERIVQERGYVPPPPGDLNTTPAKERAIEFEEAISEADVEELVSTIFGDWNYEEELASRSPDTPYVIHQDEYKDTEYTGVTLTYYEGDDILCDEHSKPVDNKDRLVGEDNLSKFGHGSGSPNIVYIRNEVLNIDMEVIKHEGNFIEEIHGLRHSDRPRRIRFEDDE